MTWSRLVMLFAPPLAVMALIFYLSAQPGGAEYSAWEVVLRKIGHLSGYALLAFTWWRALRELLGGTRRGVALVAAAAISVGYAISDELHQTTVEGRNGAATDVLIDSVGVAVTALLVRHRGSDARARG